MAELLLLLPKEEGGHYWRALFEGSAEKSHLQASCVGWVHLASRSLGMSSFQQRGFPWRVL